MASEIPMKRTTDEILDDIARNRALAKGLHAFLECLFAGGDQTLDLIRLAYRRDSEATKQWHRELLELNRENLRLTEELCK